MAPTTTAATARRPRAARGNGERLRGEIVEATTRLLARMGSDESLSLRAVAREVGVSAPSVYLHFADKEALLFAVAAELLGGLERSLDDAAAPVASDPVAATLTRAHAYVDWALAHPGHYKVIYEGALLRRLEDPGALTLGRGALLALAGDLERARAAGRLPAVGDAQDDARLLWQAVHGVVSLRINKPTVPWGPPHPDVERLVRGVLGLG